MFADKYLHKHSPQILFENKVAKNTGIIVVIPCFNEPDIFATLNSLRQCKATKCSVEVLLIINQPENAVDSKKEQNEKTFVAVKHWLGQQPASFIRFLVTSPIKLKKKWAGAGLARKTGMDEAVRRFSKIHRSDGIVVSLDADTLVEPNYLIEIESYFEKNPKHVGATLAFEHQKNNLSAKHLEGINYYEKYLQYYKNALAFTGFPYSMFTIGSAFAVRADAYVKRGGMSRRKAGEDFYFLQGLVQLGKVGEITVTKVYPSARLSDRVPFGTGPILQKWMSGEEDLAVSYNFNAFKDLKVFFERIPKLYQLAENDFLNDLDSLPESIKTFLLADNFFDEIAELNANCSTLSTFSLRFFHRFNAFKVLKFLNFSHEKFYQKQNLDSQITALIAALKKRT